jgi:hypothetical protein
MSVLSPSRTRATRSRYGVPEGTAMFWSDRRRLGRKGRSTAGSGTVALPSDILRMARRGIGCGCLSPFGPILLSISWCEGDFAPGISARSASKLAANSSATTSRFPQGPSRPIPMMVYSVVFLFASALAAASASDVSMTARQDSTSDITNLLMLF